jgi:protein TonB
MKCRTTFGIVSIVLLLLSAGYAQQDQANQNQLTETAASKNSQPRRLVHRVAPIYPQEAKERRLSGIVVVAAEVDQHGNVISAKIARGHKSFWDAALTAVKEFKFEPTASQGQPAKTMVQIRLSFESFQSPGSQIKIEVL